MAGEFIPDAPPGEFVPDKPEARPTLGGEFKKGALSGIDATQQGLYGLVSMAGRAANLKGVEEWGKEGVVRNEAEQQENAPAISNVKDIGGVRDAALWAAGGLGQLAPFMAASAVTGGVGGLVGKGLVSAAAEKAATEVAKKAIIDKAIQTGAIAGAGANSVGFETGSIYADQLTDGQTPDPLKAIGYGIPAGLLDVLPEARIIGKLTGHGKKTGLVKDIAKQVGLEGATEGAQQFLERAGANKEAFSKEGLDEALNAAALGALGGGVMGAGARALSPRARAAQPVPAPAVEEQPAPTPLALPPPGQVAPDLGKENVPFSLVQQHAAQNASDNATAVYAARDAEEARQAALKPAEQPPAMPAGLLPRPGDIAPQIPSDAGPFSLVQDHAAQNAADHAAEVYGARDRVEAEREARAAQIEQAGQGGPLSTAAASAVRGGLSDAGEAAQAAPDAGQPAAQAAPEPQGFPFKSQVAAEKRAAADSRRNGVPYEAAPSPERPGMFISQPKPDEAAAAQQKAAEKQQAEVQKVAEKKVTDAQKAGDTAATTEEKAAATAAETAIAAKSAPKPKAGEKPEPGPTKTEAKAMVAAIDRTIEKTQAHAETLRATGAPEDAARAEALDRSVKQMEKGQSALVAAPKGEQVPKADRPALEGMRGEIGWAQRGGELQRDHGNLTSSDLAADGTALIGAGEVTGRTKWIAKSDFWPGRPDKNLSEKDAHAALDKAKAGERLTPREQRFVDYAQRHAETRATEDRATQDEADQERAAIRDEAYNEAPAHIREAHDNSLLDSGKEMTDAEINAWLAGSDSQDVAGRPEEGQGNDQAHAAAAPEARPDLALKGETNAEVLAREAKDKVAADEKAAAATAADNKAKADAERGSFALSGSDRTADTAAAHGQTDLLAGPSAEYTSAKAKAVAASQEFRAATEKYRAREIDDAEFLAAKAKNDAASKEFDKAFAKEDSRDVAEKADAIEPAKSATKLESEPKMGTAPTNIADFGEKIGGARKDVAQPLGPRTKMPKVVDDRPAWARPYIAMEQTDRSRSYSRTEPAPKTGRWELMKADRSDSGSVSRIMRGQTFATEADALAAIPLAEVARKHRVYPMGDKFGIYREITDRKRAVVKGDFETRDAAMEYMAKNAAEIIEHKFPFPEKPWLDHIEREGPTDRRGNVSTKQFQDEFGFRAGEFGNWNMGSDGQAALNHAYDALHDLARILDVPPKALSLNGELAIAFGARGTGGEGAARAHYEPDKAVINLTKIKGAGSLAHEWFHALDDYMTKSTDNALGQRVRKVLKEGRPYATYGFPYNTDARPELVAAFKHLVDTMTAKKEGVAVDENVANRRLSNSQESVKSRVDDFRSQIAKVRQYGQKKDVATAAQLKAWDKLAERALAGDRGEDVHVPPPKGAMRRAMGFQSSEVVRGLNDIYKAVTGRSFDTSNREASGHQLNWAIRSLKDANDRVAQAQKGTIEERRSGTEYLNEAKKIDNLRASDYWSTRHEMGARAFESYVFDKLTGETQKSDYLVHGVENKYYSLFNLKPYPEGDERTAINSAFDKLFKTIEKKQTDKGVALMSRAVDRADLSTLPLSDKAQVERDIKAVAAGWKNGPKINVVQSLRDLPFAVSQDIERSAMQGGRVQGAFWQGEVYLVADNLKDAKAAQFVALHETVGHYGLKGILGDARKPTMERIYDGNANVRALADDKIAQLGYDKALATEEALADMAGRGEIKQLKGWQMLFAQVKMALRKAGFDIKFSDDDVAALLAKSRQHVEGGKTDTKVEAAAPVFSVAEPTLNKAKSKASDIGGRPPLSARDAVTNSISDIFSSGRSFNLWDRTVGTQFHKAMKNEQYGRVFYGVQNFLNDSSRMAIDAASLAPDILPPLDSVGSVFKGGLSQADLKAVSGAVFGGTLSKTVHESAKAAGVTDAQFGYYKQVRAAIDKSLNDTFTTEAAKQAKDLLPAETITGALANSDPWAIVNALGDTKDKTPVQQQVYDQLRTAAAKVSDMQRDGYAPLMRWGQYAVEGTLGGERTFTMHETQRAANRFARALTEAGGEVKSNKPMSTEAWKLFQGVSPDTLEIFADALGASEKQVMQEYIKLAANNRSVLKRLLQRKEVAGFNDDIQRTLAQFITSNSRAAGRNLHWGEILKAASDIDPVKHGGDVKDEAVKLIDYMQTSKDEAGAVRGLLFTQYLGGSIASALTNATQPVLMTFPYLSQFGGAARAGKELLAAGKVAVGGKAELPLAAALYRATKEGIVAPHEVAGLYAESIRNLGSSLPLRKALKVWGSLFSLAELFNRRLTFVAAYRMAPEGSDPYAFAVKAIDETQGIYNKGNRPNVARGALGATLFTFKQYSVAYVEFLSRLPPKEKALALSVLVLSAGIQGLPGAEDLQDVIDTIAQGLGYSFNSKQAMREFAVKTLGDSAGALLTHGFSGVPGVPLDVSARLGVGNLIPGSSLFKRSETDKSRDVLEFLGPAGSQVKAAMDAVSAAQDGDYKALRMSAAPVAIQNALKGLDMAQTGYYRDQRGRRVIDTDSYDAAVKAIGFQPQRVAIESRKVQDAQQGIALHKDVESAIVRKMAQSIFDREPEKMQEARAELIEWNQRNPEPASRIVINQSQVQRQVREMLLTRQQRFVKAAPPENRGAIRQEIR